MYASYDYYVLNYHGKLIPADDFEALATKASAFIDYYTLGRAGKNADLDAVKMAMCACAEQYQSIEAAQERAAGGELASESVGSYSRSYRSAAEITANARTQLAQAVQMYLAPTGLLYRGGCLCTRHTL